MIKLSTNISNAWKQKKWFLLSTIYSWLIVDNKFNDHVWNNETVLHVFYVQMFAIDLVIGRCAFRDNEFQIIWIACILNKSWLSYAVLYSQFFLVIFNHQQNNFLPTHKWYFDNDLSTLMLVKFPVVFVKWIEQSWPHKEKFVPWALYTWSSNWLCDWPSITSDTIFFTHSTNFASDFLAISILPTELSECDTQSLPAVTHDRLPDQLVPFSISRHFLPPCLSYNFALWAIS